MAIDFSKCTASTMFLGLANIHGTATTRPLANAYTHGSAGEAFGIRFTAPFTDTITDIYLYCTAASGTPVVSCGIYTNDGTNNRPNAVVNAVVTASAVASQWVRFTGLSASVTAGTEYWINCYDLAPNTSSTWQVTAVPTIIGATGIMDFKGHTTINGWSGVTQVGDLLNGLCAIKFSQNGVIGCPYQANASDTSNTLERGNIVTNFAGDITVCGAYWAVSTATAATAFKLYRFATGPTATAAINITIPTTTNNPGLSRFIRFTPITLAAGSTFAFTLTYGTNSANPGYYSIPDFSRYADVQSAAYGGSNNMYRIIDSGSNTWTTDTSSIERIGLLVSNIGGTSITNSRPLSRPAAQVR